jgi:hypothetical protein
MKNSEKITFADFQSWIREKSPGFIFDQHNQEVVRQLALYFTFDEAFEAEGHGSLDKGIFLTGPVGTGKTMLMRAISEITRAFTMVSCQRITRTFMQSGWDEMQIYLSGRRGMDRIYEDSPHCFDDLGSEPTSVKYMGNEANTLAEIISSRYERGKHRGVSFTSNLNAAEIEARYGSRIRSRLREMCNVITLAGPDRRN